MRNRLLLSTFAFLLGIGVPAIAGKAPPPDAAAVAARPLEIRATGIADVDNVFAAAVQPVQTVQAARIATDKMRTSLVTSLGLAEGTPIKDALADLKTKAEGKLKLAMSEQQVPHLSATDAIPANVQAAIDGFNASADELSGLLPQLTNMPAMFEQVRGAAAGISLDTLTKSGLSITEAPKAFKTVKANTETLVRAKDEATGLLQSVDALRGELKAQFGG